MQQSCIFIMNTKLNIIFEIHGLTISSKEVKQLLHQLYPNIPLGNKKFPYKITSQICNLQHPWRATDEEAAEATILLFEQVVD